MLLMVVAIIIVLLIAALRNSYLRFLLLDILRCMQFCGIKKGFLSVIVHVVFR